MGFSKQEYWSGVPLPSPGEQSYIFLNQDLCFLPGLPPLIHSTSFVSVSWVQRMATFIHLYREKSFSSVQSLSCVQIFATAWTAAHQASLSITNSQSLLKHMSIEWMMPSSHLIHCCPLPLQPSIFPSIRDFSNESVLCIRLSVYWSLSFNISPSNKYSGLIFFRMD